MSLKIVDGNVVGYGLFKHKENLKSYQCRWSAEEKKWKAPDNTKKLEKYIEKVNQDEKKKVETLWQKACKERGYEFVKKGTDQYNEVSETFKKYLKNSSEN